VRPSEKDEDIGNLINIHSSRHIQLSKIHFNRKWYQQSHLQNKADRTNWHFTTTTNWQHTQQDRR